MATWPLTKRPRLDLAIEVQDARLRSNVDHGPAKMRRRFTGAVRTWSFTLPLTGVEKAAIETFYTTTTLQGTASWTWTDETSASTSFRFADPPRSRLLAGHHVADQRLWEVAFRVEVLP